MLSHGRRQLLWFAVTRHPTAEWLAQQIAEAFPWDTVPPTYLVRDNDGAYGQLSAVESATRSIGQCPTLGAFALKPRGCGAPQKLRWGLTARARPSNSGDRAANAAATMLW